MNFREEKKEESDRGGGYWRKGRIRGINRWRARGRRSWIKEN